MTNKSNFIKNQASIDDSGEYQCIARSSEGKVAKFIDVEVAETFVSSSMNSQFVCKSKVEYSTWSNWSECIGECDSEGVQTRNRTCLVRSCSEKLIEKKSCQTKPCWSSWQSWKPPCKKCYNKSHENIQIGWRFCMQNDTSKCKGKNYIQRSCNLTKCEENNWNEWEVWSKCPPCYTAGTEIPTQSRSRTCKLETYENCEGEDVQELKCAIEICTWSVYGEWSACSKSCGFGMKKKTRTCLSEDGICSGDPHLIEPCNSFLCI